LGKDLWGRDIGTEQWDRVERDIRDHRHKGYWAKRTIWEMGYWDKRTILGKNNGTVWVIGTVWDKRHWTRDMGQ